MDKAENIFPLDTLKFLFETKEGSLDFFEKLTDFLPSLIYVYDSANKKLSYINNKLTDILGYDARDLSAWDNDLMKLVFKEDGELVLHELGKYTALKDNETHGFNCRLNHKEGNSKYFKTTGTILRRTEQGVPASILFVAEDITEIRDSREDASAARKLVEENEELLQFGTWAWDANLKTTKLSEGMYRLLEYKPLETDIDRNYFKLHISPTDQEIIAEKVRKAIQQKSEFEHTCKLTTALKKLKIVFTKGKIIFKTDGSIDKIMGVTHDISSLANANNDLLLSKEIINEREKFSGYGSWEYNLGDKEITWSDGMYYIFGYDPVADRKDLVIDDNFYLNHMPEENRATAKKKREEIVNNAANTYVLEYEIIGGNKQRRIIETHAKVIRDEKNNPVKWIGTTRDVTTLRQYEMELQRKISELDRSNKDLEEFAYVASHDLQEPLRKISTFGARLISKFGEELGSEGREYLLRMNAASENMSSMIASLLEYSLLSRKNQPFKECDLNEILKEVKTELELAIEETNATIISSKLPVLEAIPSQMMQVFTNLISNAIKFRKSGIDPVIKIECKKIDNTEKIKYQLPTGADFYKITFEDNGIGFEAEYASKIFQIFQRLHGRAAYSGSGIGLAICKKIIDNHHGILFAESEPGQYTKFTMILPQQSTHTL